MRAFIEVLPIMQAIQDIIGLLVMIHQQRIHLQKPKIFSLMSLKLLSFFLNSPKELKNKNKMFLFQIKTANVRLMMILMMKTMIMPTITSTMMPTPIPTLRTKVRTPTLNQQNKTQSMGGVSILLHYLTKNLLIHDNISQNIQTRFKKMEKI